MFVNVGCNSNNKIAYISANTNSEYGNTFKELNLGLLWDFSLKLPKADKSWVTIWVEGYSNGEVVEPFPLKQLLYGLSPKQVEEGRIGFGIVNPNSDDPLFFYTHQMLDLGLMVPTIIFLQNLKLVDGPMLLEVIKLA